MDRFSITPEEYLAKHHILLYLEDAVQQLIDFNQDYPKLDPAHFLRDYFQSLLKGTHTLYRDYQFIHATPYNRASFLQNFLKCFRQIGKNGDLLNVREYHSLLCLICPTFPLALVQKTARIIFLEDAMDSLTSFPDFIYALQLQLCFEEFLERCYEIYNMLVMNVKSPRSAVYIPSASEQNTPSPQMATKHELPLSALADGVDCRQFIDAITKDLKDSPYRVPPDEVFDEVLEKAPRMTFYGFLVALARSERLNASVGALPPRSNLFDDPDDNNDAKKSISKKSGKKDGNAEPD